VEVKEEYQVKISHTRRFGDLENLDDDDDDDDMNIRMAWEIIRESLKYPVTYRLGYFEYKHHKPCLIGNVACTRRMRN
jgi:hypothetical protein